MFCHPAGHRISRDKDVAGFRYEHFVSASSGARYAVCQKLCVLTVFKYTILTVHNVLYTRIYRYANSKVDPSYQMKNMDYIACNFIHHLKTTYQTVVIHNPGSVVQYCVPKSMSKKQGSHLGLNLLHDRHNTIERNIRAAS